jgi:hypothetical protein
MRLLCVIAALAAIVTGVGFCLPRDYQATAEIDIAADAASIFSLINDISNWPRWSSWHSGENSNLNVQHGAIKAGVGASQMWSDRRRGGKMWITASQPNRYVEIELESDGTTAGHMRIEIVKVGTGTRVVWSSQGRLPRGPFYGYFAPMLGTALQAELDKGLKKLKSISEAGAD